MTTPLATLADVHTYLGLGTNTTQDAVINEFLITGMAALSSWTNRQLTSQTVTEYRDGNSAAKMMLSNYPVTSFGSMYIDGLPIVAAPVPPTPTITTGYMFVPLGRRVWLTGGQRFNCGTRNVIMTYTAGFGDGSGAGGTDLAPWPADLKQALLMWIGANLNMRSRLGKGSETLAGQTVSYPDASAGTTSSAMGMPATARAILQNYMNMIPETGQ